MSTPTPYLECLILASAAYPSGFSHSLFRLRAARPEEAMTLFLAFLVLPFAAIVPAAASLRPGLLGVRGTTIPLLAVAALVAPAALLAEFVVHGLAAYRLTGRFPRGVAVNRFWGAGLTPADHALLVLVVVGEEVVYRGIWLGVLHHSFGLPVPLALGISALAYGWNHLAFGATTVASKTLAGFAYGLLYTLGGSLWLPIVAHASQNLLLFRVARRSHA